MNVNQIKHFYSSTIALVRQLLINIVVWLIIILEPNQYNEPILNVTTHKHMTCLNLPNIANPLNVREDHTVHIIIVNG